MRHLERDSDSSVGPALTPLTQQKPPELRKKHTTPQEKWVGNEKITGINKKIMYISWLLQQHWKLEKNRALGSWKKTRPNNFWFLDPPLPTKTDLRIDRI